MSHNYQNNNYDGSYENPNNGYYQQNPNYSQQGSYSAPYYPPPQQQNYTQAQAPPSYEYGPSGPFKQNNGYKPQEYYQQQNYQQQNYQQPPPPNRNTVHPRTSSSAEKWNDKPKYQDVWAAVLYLINIIALIAVAVISMKKFDWSSIATDWSASSTSSVYINNAKLGGMVGMAVGMSLILAFVYFVLMFKFPKVMIVVSYWFNVLYLVAITALLFIMGNYIAGIITAVFVGLFIFMWFGWRKKIPFATIMLSTVCSIIKRYPATLFAVVLSLIVQGAFTVLHMVALFTLPQSFSDGSLIVLIIFVMFSWYWTSQVVKNVLHVTVSGVFATFYFFGVEEEHGTGKVVVPVRNPTVASFGRSVTTSFGSICFGSLLVAILQLIRFLLRSLRNEQGNDQSVFVALCLCCIDCILSWIESLVQYFNKWAYAQVAVYGKSYCEAAKDTWALCKSRGVDAIINDCLIDNVLFMGITVASILCAFCCYFFAQGQNMITITPANESMLVGYRFLMATIGLFIAAVIFSISNSVIDSGTVATFVCLASDPSALARTKPRLFEEIRQRYPQVVFQG